MLRLLLLAAAATTTTTAYPSSFNGDLTTVKPGDYFNAMGVIRYETIQGDVCKITTDIPSTGYKPNTKYKIRITTNVANGLGMVNVLKYQGGSILKSNTGSSKKMKYEWSTTTLSKSNGDALSVYAICGSGGSYKKVHVAKSMTYMREGTQPEPEPPAPAPALPSKASGGGGSFIMQSSSVAGAAATLVVVVGISVFF